MSNLVLIVSNGRDQWQEYYKDWSQLYGGNPREWAESRINRFNKSLASYERPRKLLQVIVEDGYEVTSVYSDYSD